MNTINRSQFLKNCACGLCSCMTAGVMTSADSFAAESTPTEDWRLKFVKSRYAKLIDILSNHMNENELSDVLHDLGAYCSTTDPKLQTYRGDVDGYCEHLKKTASGDEVNYDRKNGVIIMTSPERADCFCPLISLQNQTPKIVCNCSLGWQQHTWETILGKKVQVELKESVLRGGKRCIFQILVLES
jgi:hypothetical protein